jgi:hypothetical protein
MTEPDDLSPDHLEQYCRMLGHEIRFGYCRLLPEGRPCRLIVECWQGRLDVASFLNARYSRDQIEAFLAPPKPKLNSLIELIERAKQAPGGSGNE